MTTVLARVIVAKSGSLPLQLCFAVHVHVASSSSSACKCILVWEVFLQTSWFFLSTCISCYITGSLVSCALTVFSHPHLQIQVSKKRHVVTRICFKQCAHALKCLCIHTSTSGCESKGIHIFHLSPFCNQQQHQF